MATIRAAANGNWSAGATWVGGVVPTYADDVVANSFTIQVDGSYTVLSLRNDTLGGATSGGTFVFSTNNVTMTATAIVAAVSGLISITSTTGTITITISNNIGGIATSSANIFNHNGACNFTLNAPNITANRSGVGPIGNSVVISKSSSGLLTVNGNVNGGASNGSTGNTAINSSNGDIVIVGNVTTNTSAYATISCFAINQTNGKLTIIGSVIGGGFINNTGYAINHNSSFNLEITGDITGGAVAAAINKSSGAIIVTGNVTGSTLPSIIGTPTSIILVGNALGAVSPSIQITGTGIINITGNITAGSSASGIQSTGLVKLNGVAYNTNRYSAIYAPQWTIESATTSWRHQTFAGADITLYASGASLGNPPTDKVERNYAYGPSGTLIGTQDVPTAAQTLFGVPVRNTTGTLLITPQQFWEALTSSVTLSGSFGKLIKDFLNAAVGSIPTNPLLDTDSRLDYLDAPISGVGGSVDLTPVLDAIADIPTNPLLDNDVRVDAIKERTDKIPDYPASVQSTGEQIASYQT